MPKNTTQRFILISVRIVKLRPQIIKPLLSALDAKILIVPAHLFDAFIEDNKIHNKVDKTFLIEHGIYLLQEFIIDAFAGFTDTNIYWITLLLMFFEAVILPLHIKLLSGQKRPVAQAFRLVSSHTELHGSKEASNKGVLLICEILADAFGHGDAASF